MSSIVLDTSELQQRLVLWGANADKLLNPDTGKPTGIFDQNTIEAVNAVGRKLGFNASNINVAKVLGGKKVNIGPSELVNKLLESPTVGKIEYAITKENKSGIDLVKKYPDIKGALENLAKRIALDIEKAPDYAKSVIDLNKAGKLTPAILAAYKDWYKAATDLQLLLVKKLKVPLAMRMFKSKLTEAGVDADVMIDALSKGPLAVAEATKSTVSGLEFVQFIPLIIYGAIAAISLWKASDIVDSWRKLKEEGRARDQLECLMSGKCTQEDVEKANKAKSPIDSPWTWFAGGIAVTAIGMLLFSKRETVKLVSAKLLR